jgi:hypothetical protein
MLKKSASRKRDWPGEFPVLAERARRIDRMVTLWAVLAWEKAWLARQGLGG